MDRPWLSWMTAADRCVGHVGGMAGEDDAARNRVVMAPARVQGDGRPLG